MTAPHSPTQNHLLTALPAAEFGRLSAHLELVTLLDRPGLEQAVCECYAVVKLEFDRLLADIPPGDPSRILGDSDRRALVDRPDKIAANNPRNPGYKSPDR